MNWIALVIALELGYLPNGTMVMYEPSETMNVSGTWYAEFEAEAELWGILFVGGEIKTFMWKTQLTPVDYNFFPEQEWYGVWGGIRRGPFELGFRHYCTHPVVPFLPLTRSKILWEGSYEELYLKVKLSWGK